MIEQLLRYDAIAWDFDGTLIDHSNSMLMHKFIIEHPTKRHVILTFRTHGYQNQMFRDMRRAYPRAPGPEKFVNVQNISDKAWEEFTKLCELRQFHNFQGPITPSEHYYREWKGMMCRDLRLQVLVDDKADHVLPGCVKYHIDYLHPDELLGHAPPD